MKSIFIFVIALFIGGCTPLGAGKNISWNELELEGKRLERIDAKQFQVFDFINNGLVATQLGEKNGLITAPLWHYRVVGDRLIMSDLPDGVATFEMYDPQLKSDVLTVRLNVLQSAQYQVKRK